jgi:hypothetical protein
MTDASPADAAQAFTVLVALLGIVVGLFFHRFSRAAVAGVVLGIAVVVVFVSIVQGSGSGFRDPSYAIGNLSGRVLVICVPGALLGCLIRRGFARLFRRGGNSASP